MEDRIPSLRECIDELSANDVRDVLENFCIAYGNRQKDASQDDKYAGRSAQKRSAATLRNADAHWFFRELVLNAGRALYLSETPSHDYYGEELLAVITRAAKDAGVEAAGIEFAQALKVMKGEVGHFSPDVMDANLRLVEAGTFIVNRILATKGLAYFSASENKAVRGVVDTPTRSRLDPERDQPERSILQFVDRE